MAYASWRTLHVLRQPLLASGNPFPCIWAASRLELYGGLVSANNVDPSAFVASPSVASYSQCPGGSDLVSYP